LIEIIGKSLIHGKIKSINGLTKDSYEAGILQFIEYSESFE
jgi:hypothetical protein